MKHINGLINSLNGYFGWHKSRMDCFAGMLVAVCTVGTVNLRKLAVAFISKAKIDSRYMRIKNFFSQFEIDLTKVSYFIFDLFFSGDKKLYITIDRTNWSWGRKHINILLLGIAYEGISIPIIWKLLNNKSGNATAKEHIALVTRFIKIFGKDRIAGVLADREFGSEDFFSFLQFEQLPFYIRIKSNVQARFFCEKSFPIKKMFKDLPIRAQMHHIQPIEIHKTKLFVAAGRSERGDLLIVATNQSPKNAVSIYLRRWEIETLFQSLKGRGFNFEDTHITKSNRISKLIALLAIAFCWAHKVGEWRASIKPIAFKKFRESIRPQYSFFRYGLDFIADIFFHIDHKKKLFAQCLKLLHPEKSTFPLKIEAFI